jgi:hypothetical protein
MIIKMNEKYFVINILNKIKAKKLKINFLYTLMLLIFTMRSIFIYFYQFIYTYGVI